MSRLSLFADAVHANLDDATVEKVVSKRRDGRHGKRRRVHWYEAGGTFEAARQAGGRQTTTDETSDREPAVWDRYANITCMIFAESVDTLDTLLESMVVAIDHAAPNGSVILDDYTWHYSEVNQRIPKADLNITVKLPVVDEVKGLVTITDEQNTCEYDDSI